MAACEGALLLVDAAQGVEAQTVSNTYLAIENNLQIIPIVNKVDLPSAQIEDVTRQIIELIGCDKNEIILAIGDNIRTDIRGANNMKFDSLFIIDGIHKKEFSDLQIEDYDKVLEKYKTKTNYYQERLTW